MNDFPLVTIGIPNYNYGHYILEALNSVANQTYQNIELIIVDDLSTDNSIEIVDNWINNYQGKIKINFIKNELNIGLAKTCNIILKNANGKYFQPLDADDIILPDKIKNQITVLENSPNNAMVYSNVSVINEKGEIVNPDYCSRINYDKDRMPSGRIFNELLIFMPSVLINTLLARAIGGFDETLLVQDYYLWLKLSKEYEIVYVNSVSAFYRVHSKSMSNLSSTNLPFEESVMKLKHRYFDKASPSIKKIIARNIQNSSVFLYKYNYPSSKKWLSIAFRLNPGFKTLLYCFTIRLGIPFSFFERIKKETKRMTEMLLKF
jgi:glycosyltransferase involved in cell wall biosynthesis